MISDLFLRSAQLMLRNPAIRAGVDKFGIRRWYQRRAAVRNLPEPAIATDAAYDIASGVLSLNGTWRAIGAELSRVTPVVREVEQASDYRSSLAQGSRETLDAMIDDAFDYLRAKHACVAALIEGAAGALPGMQLRDVVLANLWPSLVTWREYSTSCAALVVSGRDGTILGQNLDLGASNNVVVAHVVPDDGPARLCHLMPGWLWLGTGVNEFGLTFGGGSVNVARNFSPSPRSLPTVFCNVALLNEASSVDEAEAALASFAPYGPVHDGVSLVLTDRSGSIARIEVTGADVAVLKKEQAFAAAANHFTLDGLREINRYDDKASRAILLNSTARIERVRAKFSDRSGIDAREVRRFLRAGQGRGAWCRSAVPPDTGWTTASYVIDLGQARYHYWLGTHPVGLGWRELDLERLFLRRSYR